MSQHCKLYMDSTQQKNVDLITALLAMHMYVFHVCIWRFGMYNITQIFTDTTFIYNVLYFKTPNLYDKCNKQKTPLGVLVRLVKPVLKKVHLQQLYNNK